LPGGRVEPCEERDAVPVPLPPLLLLVAAEDDDRSVDCLEL